MRLILLLIVLATGGLLVARQLHKPVSQTRLQVNTSSTAAPQVPTTPQGLPAFKNSVNKLVNQAGNREKAQIKKETQ